MLSSICIFFPSELPACISCPFFFSHWDFYFFLILWRFYYIPGKTLLSVIHVVTLFSYFSVTCILTFFEARFRDEETESEREILNDLPRAVF